MKPPRKRGDPAINETTLRRKLISVPSTIVEKALVLYVLLTDRGTPAWVRALVLAALGYLLLIPDAIPDFYPGIGFTDDLAVMALALERASRFVTPTVRERARRLTPEWLGGPGGKDRQRNQATTTTSQGEPEHGPEEERNTRRGRRA
jgi:uncharacterized membrane protein YkvA (DUF1232 family)